MHEERRLFYVAMTRAKDELVLTSAADYGARARAQGLALRGRGARPAVAAPASRARRAPLEALARHPPAPEPRPARRPADPGRRAAAALLPPDRRLRDLPAQVPLRARAARAAARAPRASSTATPSTRRCSSYFERAARGRDAPTPTTLVARVPRGLGLRGLPLARARGASACARARRCCAASTRRRRASPWRPTAVEQEFAFPLERNRIQGRYDLVVESAGDVTILDFKTGDVRDQKAARAARAREPAARHLRARAPADARAGCPTGSSCASWRRASRPRAARPRPRRSRPRRGSATAATAIRTRAFPARPTFFACSQCPFREICPAHARWGETSGRAP